MCIYIYTHLHIMLYLTTLLTLRIYSRPRSQSTLPRGSGSRKLPPVLCASTHRTKSATASPHQWLTNHEGLWLSGSCVIASSARATEGAVGWGVKETQKIVSILSSYDRCLMSTLLTRMVLMRKQSKPFTWCKQQSKHIVLLQVNQRITILMANKDVRHDGTNAKLL